MQFERAKGLQYLESEAVEQVIEAGFLQRVLSISLEVSALLEINALYEAPLDLVASDDSVSYRHTLGGCGCCTNKGVRRRRRPEMGFQFAVGIGGPCSLSTGSYF